MSTAEESELEHWNEALQKFEFAEDSEQQGKLRELCTKRSHNIKVMNSLSEHAPIIKVMTVYRCFLRS